LELNVALERDDEISAGSNANVDNPVADKLCGEQ
jgi:hypothetical protein